MIGKIIPQKRFVKARRVENKVRFSGHTQQGDIYPPVLIINQINGIRPFLTFAPRRIASASNPNPIIEKLSIRIVRAVGVLNAHIRQYLCFSVDMRYLSIVVQLHVDFRNTGLRENIAGQQYSEQNKFYQMIHSYLVDFRKYFLQLLTSLHCKSFGQWFWRYFCIIHCR